MSYPNSFSIIIELEGQEPIKVNISVDGYQANATEAGADGVYAHCETFTSIDEALDKLPNAYPDVQAEVKRVIEGILSERKKKKDSAKATFKDTSATPEEASGADEESTLVVTTKVSVTLTQGQPKLPGM